MGVFYPQTPSKGHTYSYFAEHKNLGGRNCLPPRAIYFTPHYYQRHFLNNSVIQSQFTSEELSSNALPCNNS